ncbi:ADOP family duplicated permease [Acidicapsa dinghuensis]|uniref:ADOP family duplicated permease n=1 Tax=Acidicapsa dinghuensis TaxID=2218256 RepID=A0ABW1EDV4_9BACT|nr:ABC transporter permease [Acidicapsa dinghuensis]
MPSFITRLTIRLQMLFGRRKAAEQLNDELSFHLEQQIHENIAAGMNKDEARKAALRTFGSPGLTREQTRATWSWHSLEKFGRDLKFGARTLLRSPGFAFVSILIMALGMGATTSLFTVVRAVMLQPLPFRDPSHLVMLYEHFRDDNSNNGYNIVSPGDYRTWRADSHNFEGIAALRNYGGMVSGVNSELPEVVQSAGGSANLFPLLGVNPALGRSFTEAEDQPEGQPVVMLTWSFFQRRFAADPSIIGKQIHLDTVPTTVIGVLPPWFTYPDNRIQFWMPYAQTFSPGQYGIYDGHQSLVVARLKPGVTVAAATREVSAIQYQIHVANASKPVAEDVWSRPMIDDVVKDVRTPLIVLLASVACMLLIACLNLSNLLIARSAARRKEVAIRGALGGGRLTLIREQMVESLLICLTGGALGMLLSLAATKWLAAHWSRLPRAEAVHADVGVLFFAFALAAITALASGLIPAISSTGKGLLSALHDSSRTIGGSTSRARLRKVMLTAEIALTVTLLASAGLLFRSFLRLRTADLGCRTDHVATMRFGLPIIQYDTREKVLNFHESLLARVRSLPGVRGAALVSTVPGAGHEGDKTFTILEHPLPSFSDQEDAMYRSADPQYFSVMGIPVLRGRIFTEHERLNNDHYIIVSKKFVDQFLNGDDPLGKHVRVGWDNEPELYEIIGEVGDTLYDVTKPVQATMYFPILSGIPNRTSEANIVAWTAVDPLSMTTPIQQQISALDPQLPVYNVFTIDQIIGRTTASQGFAANLILAFAGISLLLAGVGLYGVLSYLVTQRNAEIGIRIALGAQRTEVLRVILIDGLRPVLIGAAIGMVGAAIAGSLIRSMLYGASPWDPIVIATTTGCLLLTAIAACLVPAWRASHINPIQALRSE